MIKMHFLENIILYITILYVNALLFAHFHSGLFFSHHFWCPFILLKWLRQLLSALQNETETCFLFDVTWLMYFDNALADIWKNSWLLNSTEVFFFFFNKSKCPSPFECVPFFFLHRSREMLCKSIETPLISLFCFQWVKLFSSYFFKCSWAIVLQAKLFFGCSSTWFQSNTCTWPFSEDCIY